MTRPAIEVADIARAKRRQFFQRYHSSLSYQQLKAYSAVERCRTRALGGHKDKCEDCTYEAPISYNSCRSRCCPKCQAQARQRWLETQQRDLLNTNYFHVIFTLPHELNPLGLTSPRPFLDLLFDASSQALLEVARDPQRLGAEIGFLSILHTWSSNLLVHFHIHAVVPAGGLSADHQQWIHTSHPLFLVPVPTLSVVFRETFLSGLRQLYRRGMLDGRGPAALFSDPVCFGQLIDELGHQNWYVYAQPPFGGPEHVLRYLGRYTHRMAISNHRLTAFDGERVSFRWRDYAHGGKQRLMTLDAVTFLRRFFLHVLPKGFVRIRRYGLLSNRFRQQLLPLARTLLAQQGRVPLPPPPLPDCAPWHCPRCGKAMRVVQRFTPHNSISQASILHDELRQSALPACSTHVCLAVCAQHVEPPLLHAQPHLRTAPAQITTPSDPRLPS